MKVIDRLLLGLVLVVAVAVIVPAAAPSFVTVAVVGTACFIAIELVRHYTGRF